MDARDPRRIAYERKRWLRPDWRRWFPPGFAWPEEREAERKRAELAAREAEEAAWIEAQEVEAEALARVRWMLKDLKVDLMLARLRRKYSPGQPRVPAGNPDGGQWTSGGEGNANIRDSRLADASGAPSPSVTLSDASPDPVRAGSQYAQTRVEIHPSALTGQSQIDDTTHALADTLAKVADTIPKSSGPYYGTLVHAAFKLELALGAVRGIELGDFEATFGGSGVYGSKGSVRPDVVLRNDGGDIVAIYDVKTGSAEIDEARSEKFRSAIGVGPSVPVIELHLQRGVSLKGWKLGEIDVYGDFCSFGSTVSVNGRVAEIY